MRIKDSNRLKAMIIAKYGKMGTFLGELGVSRQCYSQWKIGLTKPTEKHVDKIAELLQKDRKYINCLFNRK